jgi:hypothetical protein
MGVVFGLGRYLRRPIFSLTATPQFSYTNLCVSEFRYNQPVSICFGLEIRLRIRC